MSAVKKKRGRKSKWRDPDKPKRPYSAYNFFAKEQYPKLSVQLKKKASADSDIKATHIMTEIALKWKALNEVARKPYAAKAKQAKQKHAEEMSVYNEKKQNGECEKPPKTVKDKTKPKRAMSAYLYFGQTHRSSVKKALSKGTNTRPKVTDVMSTLALRWKTCSDSEKAKYQVKADAAKLKYDADMEIWKKQKKNRPKVSAAPKVKKGKKGKKEKSPSNLLVDAATAKNDKHPGLRV
jgi:hypothetical protein